MGAKTIKTIFIISLCAALGLLAAFILVPADASEEYAYTVKTIFRFGFFPLAAISAIFFYRAVRGTSLEGPVRRNMGWFLLCAIGAGLVCVPLFSSWIGALDWRYGVAFSICWVLGPLCMACGLFWLSARLGNFASGLFCLVASLFLAFAVGEAAFLVTDQPRDGRWHDPARGRHALAGNVALHMPLKNTAIGPLPQRPANSHGAVIHRELRYEKELFDARYTFNEKNRRIMPENDANPKADLMIFGCSYSFGHGLNDEETWPWLLAKDLGPAWRVENYAFNGFGPQQMLAMLEEKMVDPPTAPIRQALFWP